MNIKFKSYEKSDFENLVQCIENLHNFIISIDPLKRLRRLPTYGTYYANNILKKVKKMHGLILLAYNQEKIVGCIVGIIEEQNKYDLLEYIPTKGGRILDLFVADTYRNLGIGNKLMQQMEDYFKQNECDIIRVDVFEPNKFAHSFYLKHKYSDRVIDMVKSLK
jgi:GNAT superfamily N-acetyltransferase